MAAKFRIAIASGVVQFAGAMANPFSIAIVSVAFNDELGDYAVGCFNCGNLIRSRTLLGETLTNAKPQPI